ncbi:hypothetical protein niasHT_008305 [Heterodera trifolii]|uniref:BTB domain-containing protein n=1 Tax=Heterodera trifolii TaxID=157864 RepID=A0ABD2M1D0_9BILA
MEDIFGKFVVVDEKAITDCNLCFEENFNCLHCRRAIKASAESAISSKFTEMTKFATLELQIHRISGMKVQHIGNVSESDVPLAQIIMWGWDDKGAQVVKEVSKNITQLLNTGGTAQFSSNDLGPFVIRILKKRDKTDNSPCHPLSSPDDDLAVQIGDKTVTVSAHWLMSVSPVIHRMLSTEMREKQQRRITLNDLGVDMEHFMEFVEAISIAALHNPILPNPENVLVLLKLADFFQVDWLIKRCDLHLISCVEIPLIDRFLLIGHYRLPNLKNFFLHLNVDNLRIFLKENNDKLGSLIDSQIAGKLFFELCLRLVTA